MHRVSDHPVCHCCGQPLPDDSGPLAAASNVTPLFERIVKIILAGQRAGRLLSRAEVAARVYAEDADGGPEKAEDVVSVVLSRGRHRFAELGWRVVNRSGGRHGSSRYYVERVEVG